MSSLPDHAAAAPFDPFDPFALEPRELLDCLCFEAGMVLVGTARVGNSTRGFGRVFVTAPSSRMRKLLAFGWHWQHTFPGDGQPSPTMYIDNPAGACPEYPLTACIAAARSFVDAANDVFEPEDGRFHARAVEVLRWSGEAVNGYDPGMYQEPDRDLLVYDVQHGRSRSAIIDRFADESYVELMTTSCSTVPAGWIHCGVTRRIDLLNAIRAFDDPDAAELIAPGIDAIRRRLPDLLARHGAPRRFQAAEVSPAMRRWIQGGIAPA